MSSPTFTPTFAVNDEDEFFLATFPPLNADGTGVAAIRLSYDENTPVFGRRANYEAKMTVDGVEIFSGNIGSPIAAGVAVDNIEAYKRLLPSVVTFASAYEGSGHGVVCNENPLAAEHKNFLSLLSMELEEFDYDNLFVLPDVPPPSSPKLGGPKPGSGLGL